MAFSTRCREGVDDAVAGQQLLHLLIDSSLYFPPFVPFSHAVHEGDIVILAKGWMRGAGGGQ